jgi:hypothetical protein
MRFVVVLNLARADVVGHIGCVASPTSRQRGFLGLSGPAIWPPAPRGWQGPRLCSVLLIGAVILLDKITSQRGASRAAVRGTSRPVRNRSGSGQSRTRLCQRRSNFSSGADSLDGKHGAAVWYGHGYSLQPVQDRHPPSPANRLGRDPPRPPLSRRRLFRSEQLVRDLNRARRAGVASRASSSRMLEGTCSRM